MLDGVRFRLLLGFSSYFEHLTKIYGNNHAGCENNQNENPSEDTKISKTNEAGILNIGVDDKIYDGKEDKNNIDDELNITDGCLHSQLRRVNFIETLIPLGFLIGSIKFTR